MCDRISLTIDGQQIEASPGQTILEAAEEAGVYIPRLCWMKGLSAFGSCRLCTVRVNGRPQSACTQPAAPGMIVENDTEELRELRRSLIDMLFVEGNHFCMFCEKSGNCELQALAYRFGIAAPRFPYLFPKREVVETLINGPNVKRYIRSLNLGVMVLIGTLLINGVGVGVTRYLGMPAPEWMDA